MILTKDNKAPDFQAGQVIILDKPLTWTSFNLVAKLRYLVSRKLGVKKIKVGHAGTLDPLATGLMILCTGKATKTIDQLQAKEKEYEGTFFIGATTPSYDLETEVDQTFPTEHIDAALIEKARQQFIGEIDQMPPIFSALKVDGKRAYKSAREGKEVVMKTRKVTIPNLELEGNLPELGFKVTCSKGTYIRSLAFDIGKALDSGAYMSSLRRTRIGDFKIEDAWTIEEFEEYIQNIEL